MYRLQFHFLGIDAFYVESLKHFLSEDGREKVDGCSVIDRGKEARVEMRRSLVQFFLRIRIQNCFFGEHRPQLRIEVLHDGLLVGSARIAEENMRSFLAVPVNLQRQEIIKFDIPVS